MYAIRPGTPSVLIFMAQGGGYEEQPLNLPPGCLIWGDYPPAQGGQWLALQLVCEGREAAWVHSLQAGDSRLLLNAEVTDSRILTWADANYLYLRVNSLGNSRIALADARNGRFYETSLPETIYHMDARPGRLLYVLSRGIGFGSELWRADSPAPALRAPGGIMAFARFSPDGSQIAYILMPDSTEPFPAGELWLAGAGGENARRLASADAGRGFSPAWSPDGRQIAFLEAGGRLAIYELASGQVTLIERAPVNPVAWSPDSSLVFFPLGGGDTMEIWSYEPSSGLLQAWPALRGAAWVGLWQP
jgi:Tol biopolymer transport system component